MATHVNLRRRLYSLRGVVVAALVALTLVNAEIHFSNIGGVMGAFFLFLGYGLRILSRMKIGEHTRFNHLDVKVLICEGPYALTRNPLYLSNQLVIVGWLVGGGFSMGWLLAISLFISLLYDQIVRVEELYLIEKFGKVYEDYCTLTPRWIKLYSISQLRKNVFLNFSMQKFKESVKADFWTWFWQIAVFLVFILKERWWNAF